MNEILQGAFWLSALFSIYSYLIYPVLLLLLPRRRPGVITKASGKPPSMSIVVTVHNEETRLAGKLDNLLSLDPYPGFIEILVASDASTDGTDEIVTRYADRGVKLIRNNQREGKEAAQGKAISAAQGEILVFSDVATSMRGNVFEKISRHFNDQRTGAVSSTDVVLSRDGKVTGEGAYVRYEMWLRRLESQVGSLIGLSGSFFAVRAEICRKQWATNIPSDFMCAINCVRQGYVAVTADDVVGYYEDLTDPAKEYQRKVRTITRGMTAIGKAVEVLNPFRYGVFAFEVWSHKLMRWLVPWFLVSTLLLNVSLLGISPLLTFALIGQVSLYTLVFLGWVFGPLRGFPIIRIPYYFVTANLAVAHAGINFLRGRTVTNWVPSER